MRRMRPTRLASLPRGGFVPQPLLPPDVFPRAQRTADRAGAACRILRHKGPYASLHSVYHWLYEEWLMHSGREAANQPVIGEYLNNPRKVAPTELMTNVYLPLK